MIDMKIDKVDKAIKEEQILYDIAKDRYEKLGIKNYLRRMEEHKQYIELFEELKELREKNEMLKAIHEGVEEQGLLLRLPVKIGGTVYIISRNNEIIPLNVYGVDIRKEDFTILAKNEGYCDYSILSLLGKYESVDWFLTQAEAEKKLKEMESDNNGTME